MAGRLMLTERVWLMLASVHTGRPRRMGLGVAATAAALLDLLEAGAVENIGSRMRLVEPAPHGRLLRDAWDRLASADGEPLRITYALNAIHPIWDDVAESLHQRGLTTRRSRRVFPDEFDFSDRGRTVRREVVERCRVALTAPDRLDHDNRLLLMALWAADGVETGLSESMFLTDHSVLAHVEGLFDDDPLATDLAEAIAYTTSVVALRPIW